MHWTEHATADVRFIDVEQELGRANRPGEPTSRRRRIGPADYHAAGVVYLPDHFTAKPGFFVAQVAGESMNRRIPRACDGLSEQRESPCDLKA